MLHKTVDSIGNPSKETKDIIREHHFFPQDHESPEDSDEEEVVDPDYVQGRGEGAEGGNGADVPEGTG